MRVDQGLQFQASFVIVGRASGVDVAKSGIESHNAVSIGESYHHPLRNTFRKLRNVCIAVSEAVLLSMAVKALNNIKGSEGFVPSALVFGEYQSSREFGEPPMPRAII